MPSFAATLRALAPTDELPEAAHLAVFHRMAERVLHGVTVLVAGQPHRVTELEVYWNSPDHPDTFTHGDTMQQEHGRWYFHRSGEVYRGGTYKGLDIAVGREGAPAGLLIRGLERLADGQLIDGPCNCVDHILTLTGHPTIAALVETFDRDVDEAPGSPLCVRVEPDTRPGSVHAGPRVGLTLKRGLLRERARFLARPYRFLSEPARIKKGRAHIVLGMHREGLSPEDIARRSGSSLAQVQRTLAQHQAGTTRDPAEFVRDLNADETCQLLGACEHFDRQAATAS